MKKNLKIAWIMGWAIPKPWFNTQVLEVFPDDNHSFFEPSQDALTKLSKESPFDITVGYSLGSLLLLKANLPQAKTGKVFLLAPILGFTREMKLGGKIPLNQLKYTHKLLSQDPFKTVTHFHNLMGLVPTSEVSYFFSSEELTVLKYGLKILEETRVELTQLPYATAICGNLDPLLDASILKTFFPKLHLIDNATHEPVSLLKSMKGLI